MSLPNRTTGLRAVLVVLAVVVALVPLPLGLERIAYAWAVVGAVLGATYVPAVWRHYGIRDRVARVVSGAALVLGAGVAGYLTATYLPTFLLLGVVSAGVGWLWLPVGAVAAALSVAWFGADLVPPPLRGVFAGSASDDSRMPDVFYGVAAAGMWALPTVGAIFWVGNRLYGDAFDQAYVSAVFPGPEGAGFGGLFVAVAAGSALAAAAFLAAALLVVAVDHALYRLGTATPDAPLRRVVRDTTVGTGAYLGVGYVVWLSIAGALLSVLWAVGAGLEAAAVLSSPA